MTCIKHNTKNNIFGETKRIQNICSSREAEKSKQHVMEHNFNLDERSPPAFSFVKRPKEFSFELEI